MSIVALVVDDSMLMHNAIRHLLEERAAESATNGEEALEVFTLGQANHPHRAGN